ncbi:MAG: integrase core domain-containing protein [Desulfovibrio sp.]|nr:integrase core domain-containing protein [Desulfovibrio sp.]
MQWQNGFVSLDDARQFVASFVDWYNNKHSHSGICYLTPAQRHRGNWRAVLKNRTEVYEKAKSDHSDRDWRKQVFSASCLA